MLNISDAQSFLKRFHGQSEGYLCVASKDRAAGESKGWTQKFFDYPNELDKAIEFIQQEQEKMRCVYFTAHLFKTKDSRKKVNAHDSIFGLWADLDECNPEEVSPKPSVLWETSPRRYQAVWLLKKPLPPLQAEILNEKLTRHTGADPGGWALTKVLRFPGTTNFKYDPPQEGQLLWDDGPVYTYQVLEQAVSQQKEEAIEITALPKNLPSYTEALTEFGPKITKVAWDLLNTTSYAKDDWSAQLWKLEKLLLEVGIPPEYVFAIAKDSPWNKYKRDDRPDETLWVEVCKAAEGVGFKEKEELSEGEKPYSLMRAEDFLIKYFEPDTRWLIEGIEPKATLGTLVGPSDTFKTFLMLEEAVALAGGGKFLGQFPVVGGEDGPVVIFQMEDSNTQTALRLSWIMRAPGRLPEPLFRVTVTETSLTFEEIPTKWPILIETEKNFSLLDKNYLENIREMCQEIKDTYGKAPVMIYFDPLFMIGDSSDFHRGDGKRLGALGRIRDEFGTSFKIAHHTSKSKGKGKGSGNLSEEVLGSQYLVAFKETEWSVRFPAGIKGQRVTFKVDGDFIAHSPFDLEFAFGEKEVDGENILTYQVEIKEVSGEIQAMEAIAKFAVQNVRQKSEGIGPRPVQVVCGISKSTASRLLTKMEKSGLLTKMDGGKYNPTGKCEDLVDSLEGENQ